MSGRAYKGLILTTGSYTREAKKGKRKVTKAIHHAHNQAFCMLSAIQNHRQIFRFDV